MTHEARAPEGRAGLVIHEARAPEGRAGLVTMRSARVLLGVLLGLVARLWLRTLRLEVRVHPALERADVKDRPWVLAFFHGKQWPLLAWRRRRPTAVMVSLSKDGEIQSRALAVLGFEVVRGSSSRGGARGLAALVRELRKGERDAAFAVDGPRGPYGAPKPGVFLAARRANAVIVPMGSASVRPKVFGRAWDRFELAWPLSRVSVVLGAPIVPASSGVEDCNTLGSAIAEANDAARGILAAPRARMLPFPKHLPLLPRASERVGSTRQG